MSVKQGIHKNLQLWRDKATHSARFITLNPEDVTALARECIGTGFATEAQWNPVPLDRRVAGLRFGGLELISDPVQARGMLSVNGNGGFTL